MLTSGLPAVYLLFANIIKILSIEDKKHSLGICYIYSYNINISLNWLNNKTKKLGTAGKLC